MSITKYIKEEIRNIIFSVELGRINRDQAVKEIVKLFKEQSDGEK